MKRFLLLFCTVVLIGAIMIVPVLASEDVVVLGSDLCAEVPEMFSGDFVVKFYNGSDEPFWVTPVFTVAAQFEAEKCYNYIGAGPSGEDIMICSVFQEYDGVYEFYFYLNFVENGDPLADYYGYSRAELVPVEAGSDLEASPLGSIFDVFGGVGSWTSGQLGATTSLFWTGESLTFLGVLSICAVGFALILLLVLVVSRFLRFG